MVDRRVRRTAAVGRARERSRAFSYPLRPPWSCAHWLMCHGTEFAAPECAPDGWRGCNGCRTQCRAELCRHVAAATGGFLGAELGLHVFFIIAALAGLVVALAQRRWAATGYIMLSLAVPVLALGLSVPHFFAARYLLPVLIPLLLLSALGLSAFHAALVVWLRKTHRAWASSLMILLLLRCYCRLSKPTMTSRRKIGGVLHAILRSIAAWRM